VCDVVVKRLLGLPSFQILLLIVYDHDKLVEAVNDLVPAIGLLKDFSGYTIRASGFVILQALDSAMHLAERRDFIERRDLRQTW